MYKVEIFFIICDCLLKSYYIQGVKKLDRQTLRGNRGHKNKHFLLIIFFSTTLRFNITGYKIGIL